MNPFKKWISIIGVVAVIIVVLAACSPKDVPMPAGVTVTPGNGQVTISWPAVSGAASYNIYWSTTPGVTVANGTKIPNATSPYVQTGLTNGLTYYYIVTSVNKDGESAPSPEIHVTLPLSELNEYAESLISQRISMIDGVAQVQVYGSQKYAVRIQLDPRELARFRGSDEPVPGEVAPRTAEPARAAHPEDHLEVA